MINSLRRKSRPRQTSRPALLSYHTQQSLLEGADEGMTHVSDRTQHPPAGGHHLYPSQGCVGHQLYDEGDTLYNTPINKRDLLYLVSVNDSNTRYNSSVTSRNNKYQATNVKNVQYNVEPITKGNFYKVQQAEHPKPHQQYQPYAENIHAQKLSYEHEYENKYNQFNNILSKTPVIRPQYQLKENINYYNTSLKTPYDRNGHHIPNDSLNYKTRVNHNATHFEQETLNNNSYYNQTDSNDGFDTPTKELVTKRQMRTSSITKQPSFRQHQISNRNTSSNSSANSITRTVEGVVKRRKHLVLLGLDGAGKTTILMRLKYRCYMATTPTVGFNHEKVKHPLTN